MKIDDYYKSHINLFEHIFNNKSFLSSFGNCKYIQKATFKTVLARYNNPISFFLGVVDL